MYIQSIKADALLKLHSVTRVRSSCPKVAHLLSLWLFLTVAALAQFAPSTSALFAPNIAVFVGIGQGQDDEEGVMGVIQHHPLYQLSTVQVKPFTEDVPNPPHLVAV